VQQNGPHSGEAQDCSASMQPVVGEVVDAASCVVVAADVVDCPGAEDRSRKHLAYPVSWWKVQVYPEVQQTGPQPGEAQDCSASMQPVVGEVVDAASCVGVAADVVDCPGAEDESSRHLAYPVSWWKVQVYPEVQQTGPHPGEAQDCSASMQPPNVVVSAVVDAVVDEGAAVVDAGALVHVLELTNLSALF